MKYREDFIRRTETGIAKLCREYTDLTGKRRRLIYDSEGPSGSRFIAEDGSLLLVDYYMANNLPVNPWDSARDIEDSWVMEDRAKGCL